MTDVSDGLLGVNLFLVSEQDIDLTALDDYGNVATGYSGIVQLTSTDPGFVNGTGDNTLTNGVGTFTVGLKQAGTQTITATDNANAAIKGSLSITVSAGAASSASAASHGQLLFMGPPRRPPGAGRARQRR